MKIEYTITVENPELNILDTSTYMKKQTNMGDIVHWNGNVAIVVDYKTGKFYEVPITDLEML